MPRGLGQQNQHIHEVSDIIDIAGRAQASLAFTDTGADADDLAEGQYDIWATQDCYIKVHATDASDVLTNTGYLVRANQTFPIMIRQGHHLGAIRSATNGTLYYHQIG